MKKILSSLVLISVLATAAAPAQEARPSFETTSLAAGMYVIRAEIARTQNQHQYGLMFREKMPLNEGMLFIFSSPTPVCMWMKNTLLPLSVAFLDEEGKIVNIEDMKPQTLDSHCAKKPVIYALEMNQGWFKQKNIKAGNFIRDLPAP